MGIKNTCYYCTVHACTCHKDFSGADVFDVRTIIIYGFSSVTRIVFTVKIIIIMITIANQYWRQAKPDYQVKFSFKINTKWSSRTRVGGVLFKANPIAARA